MRKVCRNCVFFEVSELGTFCTKDEIWPIIPISHCSEWKLNPEETVLTFLKDKKTKEDLKPEVEFELWVQYKTAIENALTSIRRACNYLEKARFLNEMKLYGDMAFSNPPLKLQHALEIICSSTLQLRNNIAELIQSSESIYKESSPS